MLQEPNAEDCLEWMQNVPNKGMLRYLGLFNSERLLVTDSRGVKELFQTKPYDFVKTPAIRKLLVMMIGDGLVTAEGSRHKVNLHHVLSHVSHATLKR